VVEQQIASIGNPLSTEGEPAGSIVQIDCVVYDRQWHCNHVNGEPAPCQKSAHAGPKYLVDSNCFSFSREVPGEVPGMGTLLIGLSKFLLGVT
jgi:hypothetical protein